MQSYCDCQCLRKLEKLLIIETPFLDQPAFDTNFYFVINDKGWKNSCCADVMWGGGGGGGQLSDNITYLPKLSNSFICFLEIQPVSTHSKRWIRY